MVLRYSTCRFLRCIFGSVVVVMVYLLFLEIQPSTSQEVMDTTPASELKRLRADLLKNYDKNVRPMLNQSIATRVWLAFNPRHIVGLDEKYQILTVTGQVMMTWTDEYLKWDPTSYSGITFVRFQPVEVWRPDVHSLYNVKATDLYNNHASFVIAESNGTIKWNPSCVFDVPCSANYRHYPFDSHQCAIVFGAWTHAGDAIILETLEFPTNPTSSAISSEWILTDATNKNDFWGTPGYFLYHMVKVELSLKRMSSLHKYICVVPSLMTLLSSLFGFWLLPNEASRYMIGCSNVILSSLLLQYLSITVPAGKDIPLLAQYSAACLCMSGAFLLVTVITHLLRDRSGMAPNALLRLIHQNLDRYLCLSTFSPVLNPKDKVLTSVGSTETAPSTLSPDEEKRTNDWLYFSLFVDRVAFGIFCCVYVVLLAVLASI